MGGMMTATQQEGMGLIERLKAPIYEKWLEMRTQEGGHDLAVFLYEKAEREVALMMGPRQGVIAALVLEGVDFTDSPEVQKPASEGNPFPALGLWVIVGLEDETKGKRVAITRFVEPVLARVCGGVTIGQA